MKKVLSQIITAILGIWLAMLFVPEVKISIFPNSNFFGVALTSQWQIILLLGITLGLINFFVKPVVNAITLPLRIITLGLFSIVVNMAMIWILDFIFKEITVPWFWPLLWTTIIILFSNIIVSKFIIKDED
ncbi:MAG: phage holin family protein [Candidatus Staskawiczbacteria bacterium]|nr:phage holin family protein [Candidatus Staskawiczbacteria bacterium]